MLDFHIQEFFGIQQQTDGALLPITSAVDARNMDTSDGNLSVAAGYTKHISTILTGSDTILKLIIARDSTPKYYVVTANKIYAWVYSTGTWSWSAIYTFSPVLTTTQVDYVQTQIGTDDYLIIATGDQQMVKVKLSTNAAEAFGTGALSFEGAVSSYDAGSKTITPSATLSAEAIRHAVLDGVTVNGVLLAVTSATASTIVLTEIPDPVPSSPQTCTIRGGGSNAECNFCDMYYGRFVAAGDPTNPCRLYWSAVAGSGRSIEDWLAVTGSADASGGYVEVGDASGDAITGICVLSSILVIFKRYSVYTMRGDRPSAYVVERVENFSEQMANASVAVKNDIPYYLTMSGVHYYDSTGIHAINQGIRYLNTFIQTLYSAATSKGAHCKEVLYFSCKVDSASTYDDTLIVYDITRGSYMIRDGFEIADMTVHDGHLYLINGSRYVYEFNLGTSYDGTAITAYWLTQKSDFGIKNTLKKPTSIMFRATSGALKLTAISGNSEYEIDRDLREDDDGFVSIHPTVSPGRTVQLKIENIAGGAFSITGGIQVFLEKVSSPK